MSRTVNADDTTRLSQVAYHEAGHAVASYLLRRGIRVVAIGCEGEEALGCCINTAWGASFQPETRQDARARRVIEREVVITFAGLMAEARFRGLDWRRLAAEPSNDIATACSLAAPIAIGDAEINAYLHRCVAQAEDLLADPWHWTAVARLAQALLSHGWLSGRRAREVIRDALAARP